MEKWIKIVVGTTLSFLIVAGFGMFMFYKLLSRSLPVYEGEMNKTGVSAPVTIYRDNYAIPYIYAESDEDAAFTLGFLHAQERLFQMDIARRAGEGRLSEIFGSRTVPYDIMFKTVGIYRTVRRDINRLDSRERGILEAYSRGVNAYINSAKGKLPLEFDALQYDPYPWKPEHSLIIAKMMAWELNISWWTDVAFTHLVQKLGEEKARQLLPDYPENAPMIIPSGLKSAPAVDLSMMETDRSFRNFIGFTGTHIGSNNWVVNGQMSKSGKPLIANDPHLAFQAPGKWYLAVIRGRQWRAEGFTLPGVPGVVIGKNKNISWVLTNVMADDADFYMEKLDSTGRKYYFNGQWQDLKRSTYFIQVKDSERVELVVKGTHRGPIISGIHPYRILYPNSEQKKSVLSMRWVGNEFTEEMKAIFSVNLARNWNEFRDAVGYFSVPGQNFVYADNQGNIGYICAARLPVRSAQSPTFVFDGTTDAGDWKGFVPYSQMPVLFNPPENYIASANNKTVSNFSYHISNLWEPPSRIERIHTLLNSKNKHSAEDFKKYQNDQISPYAEEITGHLLNAFKGVKIKDKNLQTTLKLLEKWNYDMNEYSQLPAVFEVFFQFLMRNIFLDDIGRTLYNEYVFVANIPYRSIPKLLKENNSVLFDNVKTKDVESRDDILRTSLSDALGYLEEKLGKDPTQWQWGKLHTVTFKHMFHGQIRPMDKLIDIGPYEIGGSGTTIFNTEYSFNDPYDNYLGPSMRYIYDFARPDEFYMILTTGESGNVMSKHYRDMTEMWLTGKYIKVNINDDYIRRAGYKRFILK